MSAAALTAVVAAMPEEIGPLRARLDDTRTHEREGRRMFVGQLGGAPIALVATGDGARNARLGLGALLAELPVRRMVVIGVAGALTPGTPEGALVVAEEVHGLEEVFRAPGEPVELAARCCGASRGVVVTTDHIVDSREAKLHLGRPYEQGGRSPGRPVVVDLESAIYVSVACATPWVVLRTVSDTVSERLPGLLNRCRDDGGAVQRARVLRALLEEPRAVPVLLRMHRRVRGCAEILAIAVERLLGAWPARV